MLIIHKPKEVKTLYNEPLRVANELVKRFGAEPDVKELYKAFGYSLETTNPRYKDTLTSINKEKSVVQISSRLPQHSFKFYAYAMLWVLKMKELDNGLIQDSYYEIKDVINNTYAFAFAKELLVPGKVTYKKFKQVTGICAKELKLIRKKENDKEMSLLYPANTFFTNIKYSFSSKKPPFVKNLENTLNEILLDKEIMKERTVIDPNFGFELKENIQFSSYMENVIATIIANLKKKEIKKLIKEPNGMNTFPDLKIVFNNHYQIDFEVKTTIAYEGAPTTLASVNDLKHSIQERNPKYFTTWYVKIKARETKNSYIVSQIEIGKIWNFTNGTSINGRDTRSVYRANSLGSLFPDAFISNITDNEEDKEWLKSVIND